MWQVCWILFQHTCSFFGNKDMMIKKYLRIILAVIALCCLPFNSFAATSAKDLWVNMPDSIAPYLNQKLRLECADLYEMGVKAEVRNLLKGISKIDTLSANYLQVQLNEACSLQLGVLPRTEGDSVICLVKTFAGPEKESSVQLYSMQWQLLQTMSFSFDSFVQKPDTMSAQRYEEILASVDHYFFEAKLEPQSQCLLVQVNTAWNFTDEDKALRALLLQRKYKWDGKIFK